MIYNYDKNKLEINITKEEALILINVLSQTIINENSYVKHPLSVIKEEYDKHYPSHLTISISK